MDAILKEGMLHLQEVKFVKVSLINVLTNQNS